jgi:hypothetical protein
MAYSLRGTEIFTFQYLVFSSRASFLYMKSVPREGKKLMLPRLAFQLTRKWQPQLYL